MSTGMGSKPPEAALDATGGTGRLEAYDRIKAEILENRLAPGLRAAETELAQRLGVSRTPVREALIRLEGEGLVELLPRRGARVLPVEADDMREIYEIFTALEPEAAANLAARRRNGTLDDGKIAPIEEATAAMETALEAQDMRAWAAADDLFHRRLLSLGDNRRLERIVSGLLDQCHRARMVTLWMRDPPIASTREHRAVIDAIVAGDPPRARELFRAHRERAAQELTALLTKTRLRGL